jgi:hypothetical protein
MLASTSVSLHVVWLGNTATGAGRLVEAKSISRCRAFSMHKGIGPHFGGLFASIIQLLTGARSVARADDPEREPVRVRRALDQEQGAGARERRRR